MVWHIDATSAPVSESATLISFTATNPLYPSSNIELRVVGSGLSYDETTGTFAGTITSLQFVDVTDALNTVDMTSVAIQASLQPTLATSLTAFLVDAVEVNSELNTWTMPGFDHFGAVSSVVGTAGAATSYRVALKDATDATIGFIKVDGSNLSADPSGVIFTSSGTITGLTHLDASGAAVVGDSQTYSAATVTTGVISESALAYMMGLWNATDGTGNSDIFYGAMVQGNDTLAGTSGNDILDGGTGNDQMTGGDGDDLYYVDSTSGDKITETSGQGKDTVISTVNYTLTANVENLILAGSGNINGTGTNSDDVIAGNAGNNVLSGVGGSHDKVSYEFSSAGVTVDFAITTAQNTIGAGTDTVTGFEDIVGSSFNDTLSGNSGANILDGGLGNDRLTGRAGDDTYFVDSATDVIVEVASQGVDLVKSKAATFTLAANVENLTLIGTALTTYGGTGNTLNNVLTGDDGANTLDGAAGNDTIDGGAGDDVMIGGTGNDTFFVDSTDDIVFELSTGGTNDTVKSTAASYTLANNVESLILLTGAVSGTGNASNNVITGNASNNTLSGDAGNDTLDGGAGDDTLVGGAGNDTYIVDSQGDVVDEQGSDTGDAVKSSIVFDLSTYTNIENLILVGTADVDATGNNLANTLTGNIGNNVLTGGTSDGKIDKLIGGGGNDTYHVGTGDLIVENSNQGIDTAYAYVTYTLSANIENMILVEAAGAINGTGNSSANVITGNTSNNTIDGAAGDDTIFGGDGDDILKGNGGVDWVIYTGAVVGVTVNLSKTTAQDTVGAGTDTLTGFENVRGSDSNDTLTGSTVANIIDGRLGADTMTGGAGNDTYVVDDAGDVVFELLTGGTADKIESYIDIDLSTNQYDFIEHLTLLGTAQFGTGDELANTIIGNSVANTLDGGVGNDLLDGGAGADDLIGGLGNDTFIVDNDSDVVTENSGEGTDLVKSTAANYVLAANVENLTLTGTGAINGTGNALANTITGNSSANTLSGGAGDAVADTLKGGLGGDTYIVEASDVVVELEGQGTDTVQTAITYTLTANVENLTLTGSANVNGTGNTLANVITGNSGANVLDGGLGNDTLNGGAGNDTLTGGSGKDSFVFDSALGSTNVDTISGFSVADDTIKIDNAIFTGLSAGSALGAAAFHIGAAAGDADDRIIYDSSNGKLYFDADGNGAGAAVHFATLSAGLSLTNADFVVI